MLVELIVEHIFYISELSSFLYIPVWRQGM
jgi:hypothetical protein